MGRTRSTSLALLGAATLIAGSVPALAQSQAPMSMADLEAKANAEANLSVIALDSQLVRLPGGDRRVQGQVPGHRGQRDHAAGRFGRRDPGHHRQRGQHGSGGPRCHRRRPVLRSRGHGAGPARAVQGLDLGQHPRRCARTPTATGTATTTASWRSRRTPPSSPTRPTTYKDLLKAEYKGQVALPGDPRSSNQAIQAVYHVRPGERWLARRRGPGPHVLDPDGARRQLRPVIAKTGTILSGETPVTIRWSYNALADRDAADADGHRPDRRDVPAGAPVGRRLRPGHQRVRPASQCSEALGGVPLLRRGPARLPERVLLSDPVRRPEGERRRSPADQLAKLPDATGCHLPVARPAHGRPR